MRLARYFPTVVVGLASVAGQATMPQLCPAWDSVPSSVLAASRDAQASDYITDEAVQPAGYFDSRPRPNAYPQSQQSQPRTQPGSDSTTENRQGPMYRGQKLKLPTLPFGRQTTTNQSANNQSPNQPGQRPPQSSGYTQQSNAYTQQQNGYAQQPNGYPQPPSGAVRSQMQIASRTFQQKIPAGSPMPAGACAPYQTPRVADNRPPQPIRQSSLPYPTERSEVSGSLPSATALPTPQTSNVSPWQNAQPGSPAPKQTSAAPAGPLSPADRLVAEAHEMSTHAHSDAEFTQIIETCHRAEASNASSATVQYANNLIAWSYNRRGQVKAEAGQDQEAILDFNEAVRADANCWRALHNRGVLLAQSGHFEKAFDDFSRTIKLNPQFAKAYSNRAALFMVANNMKAALQDYNHAIELDPSLAVAHRGCGRVCQLLGQTDDAIAHYDAAVQLAPTDAYAAACRADVLTDVGRYSEAAAEYNRAIELDPKSTQAQSGSAWLLATCPDGKVRNPDLAIQRAQTVIELGGDNDAVSFDTLAAAQANVGDFDAAMDSVRKAIQLAPVDERDAYKDRLAIYQQAKPYRIAPIEQRAQQVSFETAEHVEGVAR